jgi:transposase
VYVDTVSNKSGGKSYKRHLLRESYREGGKVKKRTLGYLKGVSDQEAKAIALALRYADHLEDLGSIEESVTMHQGLSVGAVWTLYQVAKELGVVKALGRCREGKLALWQVLARVIQQGSRLSAVRLAGSHAACDILDLEGFDEDDLYENLDWLCENQEKIESRLFSQLYPEGKPELFLYDVTSTYLEGECNELAAFGYSRDKKPGKLQLVIGLLCDQDGRALSIEVFEGNTQDPKTFIPQIRKVAERFRCEGVTFVGDRGMIKSSQVASLQEEHFHYITAITKPQIEGLLQQGILQMGLFDEEVAEVLAVEGVRYVLRRNPLRAEELQATRRDKQQAIEREVQKRNLYLSQHPRACVQTALEGVQELIERLRSSDWLSVCVSGRTLSRSIDTQALQEHTKLDGCYVLKTDLPQARAAKEVIHDRYKDLALVEHAFRTCKTSHLEMRPVYVRLETRTRGQALVVMLAYRIVEELRRRWQPLNSTLEEGIRHLTTLCATEIRVNGVGRCQQVPEPNAIVGPLLSAANVKLARLLPHKGVNVATRKKLQEERLSL